MNPDAGVDVSKDVIRVGVGTTEIHTVTAGHVFEMSMATIGGYVTINTAVALVVRNDVDAEQYRITIWGTNFSIQKSYAFPTPISIPAGWDICLYEESTTRSFAFIHGKEKVA